MDRFKPFPDGGYDNKSKKANKGIICDVRNCIYHDGVGKCKAAQIAIGPTYATSSSDTICATFRPKQL